MNLPAKYIQWKHPKTNWIFQSTSRQFLGCLRIFPLFTSISMGMRLRLEKNSIALKFQWFSLKLNILCQYFAAQGWWKLKSVKAWIFQFLNFLFRGFGKKINTNSEQYEGFLQSIDGNKNQILLLVFTITVSRNQIEGKSSFNFLIYPNHN